MAKDYVMASWTVTLMARVGTTTNEEEEARVAREIESIHRALMTYNAPFLAETFQKIGMHLDVERVQE